MDAATSQMPNSISSIKRRYFFMTALNEKDKKMRRANGLNARNSDGIGLIQATL
jgi:hypothetical protein